MTKPIQFPGEDQSNSVRAASNRVEPISLRTFTPSQAVLAKSAGVFHWTPEGRRLYDYSSGVLVANLGHNPKRWMQRLATYMGWSPENLSTKATGTDEYFEASALTAYNAITPLEAQASARLVKNVKSWPGGGRLDSVLWAASGSEAVQKALWACLHHDETRDMILATRRGFHGKKGLAGAVTGTETDPNRDPRVKFISFPMQEVDDISKSGRPIDLATYESELHALWTQYGKRLNCLITEPYLGGGGSYHPPASYLQLLQRFCRQHDILFILDEVQANFGRTGKMFAFEAYGLEPDFVVLGKGLGNGIPVSAAVGRSDVMASLRYGEASDTWSANPLSCASVLATLDEFESSDILAHTARVSRIFVEGLTRLKEVPFIQKVRGEGMVFGIQCGPCGSLTDQEVASACVEACYLGNGEGDAIHLLGALAGNVLRVSPPMVITEAEARESLELFYDILRNLAGKLEGKRAGAVVG